MDIIFNPCPRSPDDLRANFPHCCYARSKSHLKGATTNLHHGSKGVTRLLWLKYAGLALVGPFCIAGLTQSRPC